MAVAAGGRGVAGRGVAVGGGVGGIGVGAGVANFATVTLVVLHADATSNNAMAAIPRFMPESLASLPFSTGPWTSRES